LDYRTSTIALPVTGSADALVREASLYCRSAITVRNDLLILPVVPATSMLTSFFGSMPKLKVVDGA